jgi:hypothetical protein
VDITDAIFTTDEAAWAAGVDLWPLRGWLAHGKLEPEANAGRIGAARHRFASVDVLRVAIVASLVRYGFSVAEADALVIRHVAPCWRTMVDFLTSKPPLQTLPVPLLALAGQLRGRVLRVSREKDGTALARVEIVYHPQIPGWQPETFKRRPHELTIDLGEIAREVAGRLEQVPA